MGVCGGPLFKIVKELIQSVLEACRMPIRELEIDVCCLPATAIEARSAAWTQTFLSERIPHELLHAAYDAPD